MTDHDFGNGPPWRLPDADWHRIEDAADAATRDGAFVAFAGLEWTSQPKYWTGHEGGEALFDGPPCFFNHKIVLLGRRTPSVLGAKERATSTPDLLAAAVRPLGGVIHNAHPSAGEDGRDQWAYAAENEDLFANTGIGPDAVRWDGKTYATGTESTVFPFLRAGRRTGFVGATDTHEGRPEARTAVRARSLTRADILDSLRHRRCWAVTNSRIVLDVRVSQPAPFNIRSIVRELSRVSSIYMIGKPRPVLSPEFLSVIISTAFGLSGIFSVASRVASSIVFFS